MAQSHCSNDVQRSCSGYIHFGLFPAIIVIMKLSDDRFSETKFCYELHMDDDPSVIAYVCK